MNDRSSMWDRYSFFRLALGCVLAFSTTPTVYAQDIDFEAARDAYEDAKAYEARTLDTYQDEENALRPLKSRLDRAASDVQQAKNRVSSLRSSLRNIDRTISDYERAISQWKSEIPKYRNQVDNISSRLERLRERRQKLMDDKERLEQRVDRLKRRIDNLLSQPNDNPWTCVAVDKGHEEHAGGHPATAKKRAVAEKRAMEACLEVHGECRIARCTQKPVSEVAELRQKLKEVRADLRDTNAKLQTNQQNIARARTNLQNARQNLRNAREQLLTAENNLASANRNRDNILLDIDDAQADLRSAEASYDRALDAYEPQKNRRDQAYRNYLSAKSESESAYNYYQRVLQNYENAKNAVIEMAMGQASSDSYKEAQTRATSTGNSDGSSQGRSVGKSKGTKDGATKSYIAGYILGRTDSSVQSSFKKEYNSGVSRGSSVAVSKAEAENLPQGYMAAKQALVSSVTTRTDTIELFETVPNNPGDGSVNVRNLKKSVGSVASPAYRIPSQVGKNYPGSVSPSFTTPSAQNTHFGAECVNLQAPEFYDICEDTYASYYASYFRSHYQSVYRSEFASAYKSAARSAYDTAFAKGDASKLIDGKAKGVYEQGILDGFAKSIATAKTEAYAKGQTQFKTDAQNGYYLKVVSASLVETNGDGIIQQGESAHLEVVVDNLGEASSPFEVLSVKVSETAGLGEVNFESRGLPSLAPKTRTTLKGVLSAKTIAQIAGAKLKITAAAVEKGGSQIARLTAENEMHFPLELVSIEKPSALPIANFSDAKFVYKNLTNKTISDATVGLSMSPALVEIKDVSEEAVTVEPGATVKVDAKIKPGVWVSGSEPVYFTSKVSQGEEELSQNFPSSIAVKRNGSVKSVITNPRTADGKSYIVRAGSVFRIKAVFDYHLDYRTNGPYRIAYSRSSTDKIRPANNSTVGVTLGSWGPNSQHQGTYFQLVVPRELKGEKAWIMLVLQDGGNTIHAPIFYLDIR